MQAAALGQGQPIDLGERGHEPRAAQSFLERPKACVPGSDRDHDQAFRRQTEFEQPWGEQVIPGDDPEYMARMGKTSQQGRGEACSGGMVRFAVQLVQTATRQPTARQGAFDPRQIQRQGFCLMSVIGGPFEPSKLGAELVEQASLGSMAVVRRHDPWTYMDTF